MLAKLSFTAVIALFSATAIAQNLSDTHEQISVPGKAVHAYRPIEQTRSADAKCHPDGTKAVACEAIAQRARAEAWASRKKADAIQLGSR